jgi:hypothetical protein
MAWIEFHQSLVSHPKTKRLARRLGLPIPATVGYLACFWCWCLEYAQDGNLSRYDAGELADAAMYQGEDSEGFVIALIEAGFLEKADGLQVHDWHDYAGRLVERRAANAKRMKDARAKNVQRTCETRAEMCEATQPNPTKPNHVHVSTHVDAPTKVASLTDGLPDLDDVLDVVVPAAKAEGVTQEVPRPATPSAMSRTKYTKEFEAFWAAYPGPRRVDKASCLARFNKILSGGVQVADLLVGLGAWKQSDDWSKDGGQFICAPLVWLNKRRWENAPAKGLSLVSDLAADRPYPPDLDGKPWLGVWLEKRGRQPDLISVMNLASALGVDAYEAQDRYYREGLAAAGDWVWDSRKTG